MKLRFSTVLSATVTLTGYVPEGFSGIIIESVVAVTAFTVAGFPFMDTIFSSIVIPNPSPEITISSPAFPRAGAKEEVVNVTVWR